MEFTVNQVAAMLGGEVRGNGDETIIMLGQDSGRKERPDFVSLESEVRAVYLHDSSYRCNR